MGVLCRSDGAAAPSAERLEETLAAALAELPSTAGAGWGLQLCGVASKLEAIDRSLRPLSAVLLLVENEALSARIIEVCDRVTEALEKAETHLDASPGNLSSLAVEQLNAALLEVKDVVWSLREDRVGLARAVRDLTPSTDPSSLKTFASLEMVLSAMDRLEVRGRDSAGVHLMVPGEVGSADRSLQIRLEEPLFRSGAIRTTGEESLSFVYKTAAEVGELGDNGARLRRSIKEDEVLRNLFATSENRGDEGDASIPVVLGHTRWASVGLINEANAHPLNQEETGSGERAPFVVAVLNGDVDNYRTLASREGLELPVEITTDAKVIPALIARRLREGMPLEDAFLQTVASFSGSVAIAAQSAAEPDKLLLALHGSGQALYVGFMEDGFIVASEPYGVVEQADRYLRMDGETPGNPENPTTSKGQVVILDRATAGRLEGIQRFAYDGTSLPISETELREASITTRDIDRGTYSHYLLKEMTQSADSFRKTLRGKLVDKDGRLEVALGEEEFPAAVAQRLRDRSVRQVIVIGQGTAAVAGQAIADAVRALQPTHGLDVLSMPATELSGFRLRRDMSATLVVAISQSGTTTDTNRTVDLVRARGAAVVSIVNRRGSDLSHKSDGVLYTSDGRDVEMSVASTKAFYSQIAAGFLLASTLRRLVHPGEPTSTERRFLDGLVELPKAMESVLSGHDEIRRIATEHAPGRRYWAVVGNGSNRAAAEEIRIKLSELCYKSIACDATEDKKHIDLSSEPMILVCAAGLEGSNLDDVAKEVAIYEAHRACPIVIATAGQSAFAAGTEIIEVPRVEPSQAFILSAMVGHLFSYEAALAIDRLALPLHEIRTEVEELASHAKRGDDLLQSLASRIDAQLPDLFAALQTGRYDGVLEASTGIRLSSLLRYVSGVSPLDSYIVEHGEAGSPAVVIEALTVVLTRGIEELTRPIDAIKHQAKTVTVGISRADEELLTIPLVKAAMDAGLTADQVSYRDKRALSGLSAVVAEVEGFTRYEVSSQAATPSQLRVVEQGGIAEGIASRTEEDPWLRGTKHLVAEERHLMVARGLSDGRTVILIPEVDRSGVVGLLLLHVRFHEYVTSAAMRGALSSYRNRYMALQDAVMETEPTFREEVLAEVAVATLLTEPIYDLVGYWQDSAKPREEALK